MMWLNCRSMFVGGITIICKSRLFFEFYVKIDEYYVKCLQNFDKDRKFCGSAITAYNFCKNAISTCQHLLQLLRAKQARIIAVYAPKLPFAIIVAAQHICAFGGRLGYFTISKQARVPLLFTAQRQIAFTGINQHSPAVRPCLPQLHYYYTGKKQNSLIKTTYVFILQLKLRNPYSGYSRLYKGIKTQK